MKILRIVNLLPIFILIVAAVGCGNKGEENRDAEARKLFDGMCRLTSLYLDSIESAKDSVRVNALMENYDTKITELNFSVKPDTDFQLTQGENDTIAMMVDSIRRVYDRKLYNFSHQMNVFDSDSLPSDTIMIKQ